MLTISCGKVTKGAETMLSGRPVVKRSHHLRALASHVIVIPISGKTLSQIRVVSREERNYKVPARSIKTGSFSLTAGRKTTVLISDSRCNKVIPPLCLFSFSDAGKPFDSARVPEKRSRYYQIQSVLHST